MAELRVRAEATSDATTKGRLEAGAERLTKVLADRIRIRTAVELVAEGSMPRNEVGKVKRVFEQVNDIDPLD